MLLYKYQALGNDYLVAHSPTTAFSPAQVALLCDRHWGFGADGLLLPTPSTRAFMGLRIFNPDGSEAEKSGNGLRIFARYLRDHCGAPRGLGIELGERVLHCHLIDGDPGGVQVQMGTASFKPSSVPVSVQAPQAIDLPLPRSAGLPSHLRFTSVGLGNPHCVIFVPDQDLDSLPWRDWGMALEQHSIFPNRVNVQVAHVLRPGHIIVRIWERGAGPTLSSGTSACAVAAAAVRSKRSPACTEIKVEMPGGSLMVKVSDDWTITLEGPVSQVGQLRPAPTLLRLLPAFGTGDVPGASSPITRIGR